MRRWFGPGDITDITRPAMIYIGIDPGVSGGLAVVDDTGTFCEATKMPSTERDLLDLLEVIGRGAGGSYARRALLERVNPGVFGAHKAAGRMGVVSAFTFGRGVGHLEMALTAANIPFDYITAGQWQQIMGCRSQGDKNVTKRRAQQLFPAITVTHAIADALLLAECCRRVERGRYVKEEGRGAQASTEAPGREGVLEEFVRKGQAAQRAVDGAIAAVGTAARHGAGPEQAPRQHLRRHRR